MAKNPPHRRPSYGWALKLLNEKEEVSRLFAPELAALSPEAREGLEVVARLAESANKHSIEAMHRQPFEPLTIAQIAREDGPSASTIRRRIGQLQVELFGRELSRSAIYYRFKRRERLGARRCCAEPGCSRPLPVDAHVNRLHCDGHRATAARVARHRRSTRSNPSSSNASGSSDRR
jgi:hypothetical protein